MIISLLYLCCFVAVVSLVFAAFDYRRSVRKRKDELNHEYRMKQLEQEERWLEVAEREYEEKQREQ